MNKTAIKRVEKRKENIFLSMTEIGFYKLSRRYLKTKF
ncbi:hypothetical protein FEDK69T_18420 [Flavobacterium enshiense DK69]|nr:hypothetical protein FEDK69T_18420 [Flavobacterium enshiense DK69]